MSLSRRFLPAFLAAVFLMAPSLASAAGGHSVKEIRGVARSGVTLHALPVDPGSAAPGGSRPGGGGKPGGGGGLPASTFNNVNASLANSNKTYTGLPVNEPFIAASGSTLIAGANDYRSGNGQGQAAAYVSADNGQTWSGAFLQKSQVWDDASNHGSGDAWLAFGGGGRAYFSAIYFNYDTNCDGGIYLVPAASASTLASTAPVEVSANSAARFEDKSAVAVLAGVGGGTDTVAVTWTRFSATSCTDASYHDSPILVATSIDGGSTFGAPVTVPAPTPYSQGSFPVFDTATGDLYVAYENWANASDVNGRIVVARVPASGSSSSVVVAAITDLPSPLPGTRFRTNSFPALAIANGQLAVTWAEQSATGFTQIMLATHALGDPAVGAWTSVRVDADVPGTSLTVGASDRFFPAIAASGSTLGLAWLDRRDDGSNKKYRAWGAFFTLGSGGTLSGGENVPIGTVQSDPSKDPFFRGQFIGDYIGAAFDAAGNFHPAWVDMRSKAPRPYNGQTQEIWSTYP